MPAAADFEDSEHSIPYGGLREAGHDVTIVGRAQGDVVAKGLEASAFDRLLMPGGWSPDRRRMDPDVVRFVCDFSGALH